MAKTLNLVTVQKPGASVPLIQRRNKFTASVENQISKIISYGEGKRISRQLFWSDNSGNWFFELKYGKQPLAISGKSTLRAPNLEDMLEQLRQLKIEAIGGGLDEALSAAANATRQNFKKDKKAGKG